jgi:hypothetical protein
MRLKTHKVARAFVCRPEENPNRTPKDLPISVMFENPLGFLHSNGPLCR